MTIWAIADIHASQTDSVSGLPLKPMDQFGLAWIGHVDRLERAWRASVAANDTVIVAGDIDWALKLEDARETLLRIAAWPGRKLLVRGNHDFWWPSRSTARVRQALPPGIELIHNDAHGIDGVTVCGAKGSPVPGAAEWSAQDAKLLNREVMRLHASLHSRKAPEHTIVALHFPPFYPAYGTSPYKEVLEQYGVSTCVYGHLHGDAARAGPHGEIDSVEYRLVAGDALGFQPLQVYR